MCCLRRANTGLGQRLCCHLIITAFKSEFAFTFFVQRNLKNAARWSNNCHSLQIARIARARDCVHAPISSASCPAMRRAGDLISEKRKINSFDRSTSHFQSLRRLFRSRHQTVSARLKIFEATRARSQGVASSRPRSLPKNDRSCVENDQLVVYLNFAKNG